MVHRFPMVGRMRYPPVRSMSPLANQFHSWLCGLQPAMEMMLTGDGTDGAEAIRVGFANRVGHS